MPALAKLYIDRDQFKDLTREELIDEIVTARQLAYDHLCRIEQLEEQARLNERTWY